LDLHLQASEQFVTHTFIENCVFILIWWAFSLTIFVGYIGMALNSDNIEFEQIRLKTRFIQE